MIVHSFFIVDHFTTVFVLFSLLPAPMMLPIWLAGDGRGRERRRQPHFHGESKPPEFDGGLVLGNKRQTGVVRVSAPSEPSGRQRLAARLHRQVKGERYGVVSRAL